MELKKFLKICTIAGVGLAFTGTANAAISFTFGNTSQQRTESDNVSTADDTFTVNAGGITATISGWSNTSSSGDANSEFALSDVHQYGSGIGVKTFNGDTSPEHAVGDNHYEEFLLFEFSELVSIDWLGNSWWSGDSDATVLAYTGGLAPGSTNVHAAHANGFQRGDMTQLNSDTSDKDGWSFGLTNAGWTALDHTLTGNLGYGKSISNNLMSNYWLIGNANQHLNSTYGNNNDFFKLNLVKVETCVHRPNDPKCGTPGTGVPAPATAALLGLGLLLLRKRKLI